MQVIFSNNFYAPGFNFYADDKPQEIPLSLQEKIKSREILLPKTAIDVTEQKQRGRPPKSSSIV